MRSVRGSMAKRLASWARRHFDIAFIFTPVATSNVRLVYEITDNYEVVDTILLGHTNVFIFGVRVASFQRTTPW